MSERQSFLAQYGDENHINKVLDDEPYNEEIALHAARNPSVKEEHYNRILKYGAGSALVQNHSVPHEFVERLSHSARPSDREDAINSLRLPQERIEHLFKHDTSETVKSHAAKYIQDPQNIHDAISHPSSFVRSMVGWNRNLTPEHVAHAVKTGALMHDYHLNIAMPYDKFKTYNQKQRDDISSAFLEHKSPPQSLANNFFTSHADHISSDHLRGYLKHDGLYKTWENEARVKHVLRGRGESV